MKEPVHGEEEQDGTLLPGVRSPCLRGLGWLQGWISSTCSPHSHNIVGMVCQEVFGLWTWSIIFCARLRLLFLCWQLMGRNMPFVVHPLLKYTNYILIHIYLSLYIYAEPPPPTPMMYLLPLIPVCVLSHLQIKGTFFLKDVLPVGHCISFLFVL